MYHSLLQSSPLLTSSPSSPSPSSSIHVSSPLSPNHVMDVGHVIASRFSLLYSALMRFFSCSENVQILVSHLSGKSRASLRLIDWYVTSYAKSVTVLVPVSQHSNCGQMHFRNISGTFAGYLNVYASYRMQLRSFSKAFFDPFRRHNRMTISLGDTQNVVTTIGQLNFFKWLIESGILDYIYKHIDTIETDMRRNASTSLAARLKNESTAVICDKKIDSKPSSPIKNKCISIKNNDNIPSQNSRKQQINNKGTTVVKPHSNHGRGNMVLMRDANVRISF